MLNAFFSGAFTGLILAISIGPAFFALLDTSIRYGVKPAIIMALGVLASDFLCVWISYFGAAQFFNTPQNTKILGIIGGVILILFGLAYIIKKKQKIISIKIDAPQKNIVWMAVKGFIVNMINPFVLLFWLGLVSITSSKYSLSTPLIFSFFSGTLVTVFVTDMGKIFGARSIKKMLTENVLVIITRIVGIALIALGLQLIVKVLLAK